MVKHHQTIPLDDNQHVDIDAWLAQLNLKQEIKSSLRETCFLCSVTEDHLTFYGQSCFIKALEMGRLIADLNLDQDAIAAAIAYCSIQYGDLKLADIAEQLGEPIAKLVEGIQKMHALVALEAHADHQQIDTLRRMLLAMASDVRVVVVKLSERLVILRSTKHEKEALRRRLAEETLHVYAPLANRLGIHLLKWELEDLAFHYLEPETYKKIAQYLQHRRVEREENVLQFVKELHTTLSTAKIKAEVYGRAKHIYSIYRKMQLKNLDFNQIYDTHAVRILVPEIKDCYTALSIAHDTWTPISNEFDDYIHAPKPNGYQSIHTAVVGPHQHNFEIQIRTFQMHEDAEKGVAAHWLYKEGGKRQGDHEDKVAWLRQLLEWQKEMTQDQQMPADLEKQILEDHVYVFTPNGQIIDLPQGSTPLDFAYTIHTEIGHRCRGAKVNGKIVPLTYTLKTGEKLEILTAAQGQPSRDWLSPQQGYLKTSRARAKVLHWFKQQDYGRHVEEGRALLDREKQRLNFETINFDKIATELGYKSSDPMLAALGTGDLRIAHILNLIEKELPRPVIREEKEPLLNKAKANEKGDVSIYGVGNMLTHIAKCCKPIPGDPIMGYVTQGHGVSIHHQQCAHITRDDHAMQGRLIEVEWRSKAQQGYAVDIQVKAYDRQGLVRDITNMIANEKVNVTRLNSSLDPHQQIAQIDLTIEVLNIEELSKILERIHQLPNVYQVSRRQ